MALGNSPEEQPALLAQSAGTTANVGIHVEAETDAKAPRLQLFRKAARLLVQGLRTGHLQELADELFVDDGLVLRLFMLCDKSGDGRLSRVELLEACMTQRTVAAFLGVVGVGGSLPMEFQVKAFMRGLGAAELGRSATLRDPDITFGQFRSFYLNHVVSARVDYEALLEACSEDDADKSVSTSDKAPSLTSDGDSSDTDAATPSTAEEIQIDVTDASLQQSQGATAQDERHRVGNSWKAWGRLKAFVCSKSAASLSASARDATAAPLEPTPAGTELASSPLSQTEAASERQAPLLSPRRPVTLDAWDAAENGLELARWLPVTSSRACAPASTAIGRSADTEQESANARNFEPRASPVQLVPAQNVPVSSPLQSWPTVVVGGLAPRQDNQKRLPRFGWEHDVTDVPWCFREASSGASTSASGWELPLSIISDSDVEKEERNSRCSFVGGSDLAETLAKSGVLDHAVGRSGVSAPKQAAASTSTRPHSDSIRRPEGRLDAALAAESEELSARLERLETKLRQLRKANRPVPAQDVGTPLP